MIVNLLSLLRKYLVDFNHICSVDQVDYLSVEELLKPLS